MRMTFGKYRDQELCDVPEDYLAWVLDNCKRISPTLRRAIEQQLGLENDPPPPPPPAPPNPQWGSPGVLVVKTRLTDAVRAWQRRMAKMHHPDRGGSVELMQAVNGMADELLKVIASC